MERYKSKYKEVVAVADVCLNFRSVGDYSKFKNLMKKHGFVNNWREGYPDEEGFTSDVCIDDYVFQDVQSILDSNRVRYEIVTI